VEPNQIDILAFTVLGNLEQIDETQETRLARQLGSDIGKTDGRDGIHLDLAFFHAVPGAHFDVRTHPYPDAASDFSAANSLAKPLGEHHAESLHPAQCGILGSARWNDSMIDAVDALILDLLEWLAAADRSYEEVMGAWRTSCPRLPVWEDANDRGLVATEHVNQRLVVRITPEGRAFLHERRPSAIVK